MSKLFFLGLISCRCHCGVIEVKKFETKLFYTVCESERTAKIFKPELIKVTKFIARFKFLLDALYVYRMFRITRPLDEQELDVMFRKLPMGIQGNKNRIYNFS